MNAQAQAAKLLVTVGLHHRSLDEVFQEAQIASSPLVKELCYGTLRWHYQLDELLGLLLRAPSTRLADTIHELLLLGLYQLLYLRKPQYAVLNETVEAARALQAAWAVGLVNAVLRNFLRQQMVLLAKLKANPVAQYAHPAWLIKLLSTAYPECWGALLEANNQHPPLHLRVNLRKLTREAYWHQLQRAGLLAHPVPTVASALTLATPCEVGKLPGFSEGLCSVHDLSAQRAAALLALQPGLRVLDACAAPGGKSAHILETEPNLAELVALEIAAKRLSLIQENFTRLGLEGRILKADASQVATWWDGQLFDRILLDAPCSGTGVIRRHPDIKLLRRPTDIPSNARRQLRLLEALWPLLSGGGLLVYATCSVLPQENCQVIQQFLATHSDAQLQPIEFPDLHNFATSGWQILPSGAFSGDGFYYAVLAKARG